MNRAAVTLVHYENSRNTDAVIWRGICLPVATLADFMGLLCLMLSNLMIKNGGRTQHKVYQLYVRFFCIYPLHMPGDFIKFNSVTSTPTLLNLAQLSVIFFLSLWKKIDTKHQF